MVVELPGTGNLLAEISIDKLMSIFDDYKSVVHEYGIAESIYYKGYFRGLKEAYEEVLESFSIEIN